MKREKSGLGVWAAAAVFYPLSVLLARTAYIGAERIPREGGALLVMNHVSHLDPVFDSVFVHRQGRVPHVFAKHTLWRYPLVRQVLNSSGQIPVYRASPTAGHSLRDGATALREGKIVVIYPDGTITRDPNGWPMRPRTGAARLVLDSLDAGVPVLPVARWGTLSILDVYRKKFRPFPRHRVTFSVGEPLDLSAYQGKQPTVGVLRELSTVLIRAVNDRLTEIRHEPAPEEPYLPSGNPAVSEEAVQDTAEQDDFPASGTTS